jgi:hypothetical protein
MWFPDTQSQFASLPGFNVGFPTTTFREREFSFPNSMLRSARLIRHGGCSRRVPITELSKQINDAIWSEFRGTVWDKGATPAQEASFYQMSFVRDADATLPWTGNADGFSILLRMFAEKFVAGISVGSVRSNAIVSYKLILAGGGAGVEFLNINGGDDASPGADPIFPTLAEGLRDRFPAQFNAAATAPVEVKIPCPSGSSPTCEPKPVPCQPASCGTDSEDAVRARCQGSLRTVFVGGLIRNGMPADEANATFDAIPRDQFSCVLKPNLVAAGDVKPGHCAFRAKFKRVVATPEYMELVWFEQGEAASPDYWISTLNVEDAAAHNVCATSGLPTGPKVITNVAFAHPSEEGSCPTLIGCQPCQERLAKGCPMPAACTASPLSVGSSTFCGTCPRWGTLKRDEACVPGAPPGGSLCAEGLLCYSTVKASSPGSPISYRCEPSGSKSKVCYTDPKTKEKYVCGCAYNPITGDHCDS